MLTLYHAPRWRSTRVLWLCHELDLPIRVETVSRDPSFLRSDAWRAISPAGKVPVLRDGELVMFESGAMVEVILDRYGAGRLRPEPSSNDHARYLQWSWFAEATLSRPLGVVAALRHGARGGEGLAEDVQRKLEASLHAVEDGLQDAYICGDDFTAADVMLGYTLSLLEGAGLLQGTPRTQDYLKRLHARPAWQRATASDG